MSAGLVCAVGLIYAYISVEQFILENPAVGFMYFGYALANCGAWFLVK